MSRSNLDWCAVRATKAAFNRNRRNRFGINKITVLLAVSGLLIVGCLIYVALNLVERSEQNVQKIKDTKVFPSKQGWSPSERETIAQLSADLKKPGLKQVAYTDVTLSWRAFRLIKQMKGLHTLDLTQSKFSNKSLRDLEDLQLVILVFKSSNLNDEGLTHVCRIQTLQKLELADTKVTDVGMEEVAKLPNLVTLGLNETKVTTAGIKKLKGMRALSGLNYVYHDLTEADIDVLLDLKNITYLDLSRCRFTPKMLEKLASASHLWGLFLKDCALKDSDVEIISKSKSIKKLGLDRNPFGAKGLRSVEKMKLDQLEISDTKNLPEAEVTRFKQKFPKVNVIYAMNRPIYDESL